MAPDARWSRRVMVVAPPTCPGTSPDESEDEHPPQRDDAVAPTDLLALGIGAAVVGDRNLVDPHPEPRRLDHQLGLDVEAVGPQRKLLQDRGTEGLVADLHVAQ